MLYGALPGTLTGQLSVPHQNPGGPSPAGRCAAAVTAWLVPAVTVAVAVPPLASTSASPAASVIHDRFMIPPGGVPWVPAGRRTVPTTAPHPLPSHFGPNGPWCALCVSLFLSKPLRRT